MERRNMNCAGHFGWRWRLEPRAMDLELLHHEELDVSSKATIPDDADSKVRPGRLERARTRMRIKSVRITPAGTVYHAHCMSSPHVGQEAH